MKKTAYISLILFIFASCSVIMKKVVLGIKKPKIENEASISKYLQKYDLDISDAFILSDSLYIAMITENTKYFSKYEVYNSELEKIIPKDTLTNQCYGNIKLILQEVDDTSLWVNDTVQGKAHALQRNSLKLNGTTSSKQIFSDQAYYVVFYWAKFMGSYTKSLLDIASGLEQQNKPNVEVITINMDKNVTMTDSIQELKFNF